jgi:hypothetical protein
MTLFALNEFALGITARAFFHRCGLWRAFCEFTLGIFAWGRKGWAQRHEAAKRQRSCKFLHKSTPMGAKHHCPQPHREHISNICAVK